MIIDTHCHLDLKEFDLDREAVVKNAAAAGVEKMISVGVDLKSSQRAVELSQKYPEVYAAVGIQPEEVRQYFEESPDPQFLNPRKLKIDVRTELEKLALNKKVVAIGECGLDYHYLKKRSSSQEDLFLNQEKQKDIFRRQLGTAVLLDLPVIIHNREADEDLVNEILRYKNTGRLRGVFHCFTASLEFAQQVLDLGFYLSFTGIITYPNSTALRKVVEEIPLEKIMVETDSPFLSPQAHRGQRNQPAFVTEVVKTIAQIKNISVEEVSQTTSDNARRLFKL